MIKLAVGVPAYRMNVHALQGQTWLSLGEALADNRDLVEHLYFQASDLTGIAQNRNRIAFDALEAGADAVLMMDSDNYQLPLGEDEPSPGEMILRMVLDLMRADAAIIAAPIPTRDSKNPRLNVHREIRVEGAATDFAPSLWQQWDPREFYGRVLEVDAVGTGLCAINLAWLRRVWPEPPWFQTTCLPGRELHSVGEDYHFCQQARRRGGKVLVDGRMSPTHGNAF